MRIEVFRTILLCLSTVLAISLGFMGCRSSAPPPSKTAEELLKAAAKPPPPKKTYKKRQRISVRRNLYEGSLWRDEASFGNLLRDHRARFRHDLLTINDVARIVTVPPSKKKKGGEEEGNDGLAAASRVLASLSLKEFLEEEQNDILRSLDTISAEVVRVLPNGNMVVEGKKIDYRQRNEVQYVTTITGILRPADVEDSNEVSATKLVYPDVKIKRRVLGDLLRQRLKTLAPLIGKRNAGFIERLSDFAATKNKSQKTK